MVTQNIEDELQKQNRNLEFLRQMAFELAGIASGADVSVLITRQLREFTGAVFVTFSEYIPERKSLFVRHVDTRQQQLKGVMRLLGDKKLSRETIITPESYQEMTRNCVQISESSEEVSFKAIPEDVDVAIKTVTGVVRYCGICFVTTGDLYGASVMGFAPGVEIPSRDFLESMANLAAISLRRSRADEELRASIRIYRELVERMPDGVYKSTHDGRFVEANPAMVKMLGYDSREDLFSIHIPTQLYFSPDDRESLICQHKYMDLEVYPLKRKDGSPILVEDHGWYVRDEYDNILYHEGILRDVTERQIAQEELAESEDRYRVFINATRDMVFQKDEHFRYQFVNKSLAEFFGRQEEEVIGRTDEELMTPEASLRCRATDMEALQSNEVVVSEEIIGTSVFESHKFRVPLKNGNFGVGGYIRDITARRESEIRLRQQAEELKALNASRDKFFSIIAHDLKSPFSAILGFSDLLLETYSDLDGETMVRSIEAISGASKQAYNLLDNLLIWSRTQTGRITVRPDWIDVHDQVIINLELLRLSADKKSIRMESKVVPGTTIHADRNMFETIVRNLVSNAIKFTRHHGQVVVDAAVSGSWVIISVKDTGVGMSPEQISSLFRVDSKSSTPGTDKERGSGLGLLICKEFVEKHGGSIRVESEPGKGSTFYFSMPAG